MLEIRMSAFFLIKATFCVFFLLCFLPGSHGISCYYCNGVTDYDPNNCWRPTEEHTIIMECQKDEWCEKKVSRIDSRHEKIERGCSSNCDGRTFVYTDDFDVHCCNGNTCNGVPQTSAPSSVVSLLMGLSVLVLMYMRT